MELTTLKATSRVSGSSRGTGRLRKEGMIPGVYYGKGQEAVSISVSAVDISKVLVPGKRYTLLDLEIDGKKGNPAVIYSYQKDSISLKIEHIDFLKIDATQPLMVRVPVILKGLPVGVKNEGGLFSQIAHYLKVSALPEKIPTNISLDVTDFHAGTTFYAKEFKLEGIELASPARTVVFTISTKAKAAKEAAAAEALLASAAAAAPAAATPAEGAAAPAAPGAAPGAAPAAGDAKAAPAAEAKK
ncbi:MAG: 50S ribosomal protein L25 [Fibrobacteraceae bacterium]|nr:50S ribosomal protein L25 [Fibrobacteraceae bacterium]